MISRKFMVRFALFILWVVLAVPFGGMVLAVKDTMGVNVFTATGFHSFRGCLAQHAQIALGEVETGKVLQSPKP